MNSHLYKHELIKFPLIPFRPNLTSLSNIQSLSNTEFILQPIFPINLNPIYPLKMQSNQFLQSGPARASSHSTSIQIEIFLLPLALLLLVLFHSISSKFMKINISPAKSKKPQKLSTAGKPRRPSTSLNIQSPNPDSIQSLAFPLQVQPSSPSSN